MVKKRAPRHGSMQFWPRRRAKKETPRIRSWAAISEVKPLGFLGYKVGMCHINAIDNRPKSLTVNSSISIPVTIIETPPLKVLAVSFYKYTEFTLRTVGKIMCTDVDKEVRRKIRIPKNVKKKFEDFEDTKSFDFIRLIVYTQPKLTTIGSKKPKIKEIAVGGSKENAFNYAKEKLGREITVDEVFSEGNLIDLHGVSKGKGFQGTTKRYGTMLKSHKSEKGQRGVGNLGAWHPVKVQYTICQPGKMGYHLRTEYNKWLVKIGKDPKEISRAGGIHKYGVVNNDFILVKGGVVGAKKRVVLMSHTIRGNRKVPRESPKIRKIIL